MPALSTEHVQSLTLTPEQETVRCTICGKGADDGGYRSGPTHVVTTVYTNSTTHEIVESDHEPVCDNVAPDGDVYPFGRIVATEQVGPYTITTVQRVRVDGSVHTRYCSYVDADAIGAEGWKGEPGTVHNTHHSHDTLDQALAYSIAYRHVGPNTAQHVSPHFIRGLTG